MKKAAPYSRKRGHPFRYELRDLPEGPRILRLALLAEKHPASKDRRLNLAGFDVICPLAVNLPASPRPR